MSHRLTAAVLVAVMCLSTPASAVVFINEILHNPSGSSADDTREFIELMGTPGMKLDGYAIAYITGGQVRFYPLNSIPPRPAVVPEFDEFFSLDGLALGPNGILVLGNGSPANYPTILSDSAARLDWDGDSGPAVWNGDLDAPNNLENDGSATFLLVRNRPGATEANGLPSTDLRWGKDINVDDEVFHGVVDPQDSMTKDLFGDGNMDKGQSNGGLPDILVPAGYPVLGGNTLDIKGAATLEDITDDLEIVDEVSYEHDRGWEYDEDDRHVDVGNTAGRLQERRVHAIGDPQGEADGDPGLNPDALTRVDYRTKGGGWTPVAGGSGEMANGNNWQDTATEQWIRGESVVGTGGVGGAPQFFYDNTFLAAPDTNAVQPYLTNVPLWLADASAPDYNFSVANTYQLMAGRINPLAVAFIPGDTDRDGDCDADDIAKLAAVFGDDDWIFSNGFEMAPESDSGDPATQTRPWDVDATGDNGIEPSDLQWTLNFQGNTNGQIVGRRYDSTTPAAVGVTLNSNAGVTCTVTASAVPACGRPLNALAVGDVVDLTVSAAVTAGANNAAGQQNGIMQFVHDLNFSSGGVLRAVSVQALGPFAKTRAGLESPQGVMGDAGLHAINGYTTSFTTGLSGAADMYRVTLEAVAPGSVNVSVAAASLARLAASTPRGLKIGHATANGDPASSVYPAAIALTVTPQLIGDIDGNLVMNATDISLFVGVLQGTNLNPTHIANSDLNCDGNQNGLDIRPFTEAYFP